MAVALRATAFADPSRDVAHGAQAYRQHSPDLGPSRDFRPLAPVFHVDLGVM